jgi:hypothetical protein
MKISEIRSLSISRGDKFFMDEKRIVLNGSALIAPATAFTVTPGKILTQWQGHLFATMEPSGYFKIWFFMTADNSITEVEGNEKYTTIAEVESKIHSVEFKGERRKPNRLVYTTADGLEIITKEAVGIRLGAEC